MAISTAGYPDATNTGVPAGTTLTPYYGNLVITTPGAVISGLDIHGTVTIKAPGVTIQNCNITNDSNSGSYYVVMTNGDTVIQDCTINGNNTNSNGINGGGTFLRNNIYGVENGIDPDDNTLIQDNYIHDLKAPGSPHYDGIELGGWGNQNNIIIRHNTVDMGNNGQTGAINLTNDFGSITNVTIDNNLLKGGSYTIYTDNSHGGGPISNITITNNIIHSGQFGNFYFTTVNPSHSGNINYDTGAALDGASTSPVPTVPSAPSIASFSDDSGVAGDGITNDNTLTLQGTAAANSTVKVFDGATQIGTATANSSGAWSYTTSALADGAHSLTAKATNSAGTSVASAAVAVKVDTVAPNAPTVAAPVTNANGSVNLTGTAEANSTVKVFDGATQIGTATANSNGAWSLSTGALATGSHSFTAKATDVAGNTGAASAAVPVTINPPAPPSAPTIASYSNDTGVAGDGITSDSTLTLTGTAVANSTVKVFDGATQIGTATANASGAWSYTTSALADGSHSLTAKVTDSSGNTSSASAALAVNIDTTAPAAPVALNDAIVNGNQVLLNGTAEANSTVKVYDGLTLLGTTTAKADGTWSVTTSALSPGAHDLTATATDAAGNTSAVSAPLDPVINGPAPSAPTIASYSNDTGVAGDGITSDNTLTLAGTAAANSTVKVFDGATQIGTATANASGAWSLTTAALADGAHNLTAKVTDASGQTSAASTALAVKIDTTAPNAPTVAAPVTNTNGSVSLTGTAEANSTVKVFDGTTQIGTATANSNGSWSLTTGTLTTGNHNITAEATDAAGNTGAASGAVVANIPSPTPAPTAPKISSFSNDSGVAGDGITNDNTLTLTGTAAANSTVKVFDGAAQIGTATANASGAWSYTTAALADGAHSLTAKVTDASGQTSAASAALAVKIDTAAPNAPTMTSSSAAAAAAKGTATANTVTLSGTAEANSTVTVFDGKTQIGTATANSNGAWSLTTGTLTSGNHTFTSKSMDAAGNTSVASAAVVTNIPSSTPAPTAPKISSFSNDTGTVGDNITSDNTLTLKGTAAANSTVKVFDGTTQIGTATANSSGAWSYTTAALADGAHNLTAKVTDASGQTSSASSALAVKIDTKAPTAPKIASDSHTSNTDHVTLTGTAEANSTIKVFDGTKQIGTATTDSKGVWTYAADSLSDGSHNFTTKAMDAAGNTSGSSATFNVKVDTHTATPSPSAEFTNVVQNWNDTVTFKGTADPNSLISIYDNGSAKAIGNVKVGSDGTWSYKTSSAVSDGVHNFTATVTDKAGNTSSLPGSAVLGTGRGDVLNSTSGNDLFKGNGGNDTFVFTSNFGADVISNFSATGRSHDVVQFSKSVFDSFADVLAHASQSGHDVVIDAGGGNTLTLKDTKLAALDKTDFHFA